MQRNDLQNKSRRRSIKNENKPNHRLFTAQHLSLNAHNGTPYSVVPALKLCELPHCWLGAHNGTVIIASVIIEFALINLHIGVCVCVCISIGCEISARSTIMRV